MQLSELTAKQRKILKLIITGEIGKGYIMLDRYIDEQQADQLIALAQKNHIEKRIAALADDLK